MWFGLCPTYQSINNYNAICKQLGYLGQSKISRLSDYYKIKFNKGARSSLDPFFKLPVVPYYHKQFLCTQNDGNFSNCRTAPTPCPPQNNVYLHLKCQGIIIIIKVYKSKFFTLERCKNEDIRLQGAIGQDTAGRVEVCVDREWRSICQDNFGYNDASVVCRQLGFSPYGKLPTNKIISTLSVLLYIGAQTISGNVYSSSNSFYIYELNCTGYESSIWDCPFYNQSDGNCRFHANVVCQC